LNGNVEKQSNRERLNGNVEKQSNRERLNGNVEKQSNRERRLMMLRGELWWAELPDPEGSEPAYTRPVLVIQSDHFNRTQIRTVLIVPLTSNLRLASAPGNVFVGVPTSGLAKDSVINTSQIYPLSKSRLIERVTLLDSDTMRLVEAGIRLVLGLV
jgi:mRNA interferase MazF